MNVKRKLEAVLPPRPPSAVGMTAPSRAGPASTSTPHRTDRARATPPRGRARASTTFGSGTTNGHAPTPDEPRAAKRTKKGGGEDDTPSLLSRLASATTANGIGNTSNGKAAAERVPHKIPPKPRVDAAPISFAHQPRAPPPDPREPPVGGWSIRGAAKAVGRSSPADTSGHSLLERLQSSDDWEGGRRKRRTKI
ncbi:hypothetical protein B0H21DRAFT_165568 [Amylocystis lapponica]|nr:hypothetical protein B0H21DRAFT_165568 [Amylocystis lapponica]